MQTIESLEDIQDIARGAVLLGTGGGGDPYIGELFLQAQLKKGRKATIIDVHSLKDDAFIVSIAGIGSPPVLLEHLVSEKLLVKLLARAESAYGRKIDALISAEIGGANSMFPLALSAISGIPVIDGDGIGRAVPHIHMTTFSIFGVKATPCVLMDESGNVVTVDTIDDHTAEEVCRVVTGALGACLFAALYPMSGKQAKDFAVLGTLLQALQIGRRIRQARVESTNVFAALLDYLNAGERFATILFEGKIVDVSHETRGGWHIGRAILARAIDSTDRFVIEIKNEFTIARLNGRTVAIVPDLICVLDAESGEPLTGEMLHYGQRVRVLGYSAPPLLRGSQCLQVIGPRMFGFDEDFVPLEELAQRQAGE